MVRTIQRRPQQDVHARIDDHDPTIPALLDVLDTRQQHARIGTDRAARLDHEPHPTGFQPAQSRTDRRTHRLQRPLRILPPRIRGRETTADVERVHSPAQGCHPLQQALDHLDGRQVGAGVMDRRSEVHMHPLHRQMHVPARHEQHRRLAYRYAELGLAPTGRGLLRGGGIRHIGVDADRDLDPPPALAGNRIDPLKLALRLDIEQMNTGLDRITNFLGRFAYSGKHNGVGGRPRQQRTVDFPATDHVYPGPLLHQKFQNVQVAATLDRVADQRINRRERILQALKVRGQGTQRVHEQRRPQLRRQRVQVHVLAMQHAFAVVETVHCTCLQSVEVRIIQSACLD
nr:hypothetical protein [Pseudomonas brassicae]